MPASHTHSRYLCPIGGMNGMFAKLAVTELRARQGVCSGECRWEPAEGRTPSMDCRPFWALTS